MVKPTKLFVFFHAVFPISHENGVKQDGIAEISFIGAPVIRQARLLLALVVCFFVSLNVMFFAYSCTRTPVNAIKAGGDAAAQFVEEVDGECRFAGAARTNDYPDQIGIRDRLRQQLAFDIGPMELTFKLSFLCQHHITKIAHLFYNR